MTLLARPPPTGRLRFPAAPHTPPTPASRLAYVGRRPLQGRPPWPSRAAAPPGSSALAARDRPAWRPPTATATATPPPPPLGRAARLATPTPPARGHAHSAPLATPPPRSWAAAAAATHAEARPRSATPTPTPLASPGHAPFPGRADFRPRPPPRSPTDDDDDARGSPASGLARFPEAPPSLLPPGSHASLSSALASALSRRVPPFGPAHSGHHARRLVTRAARPLFGAPGLGGLRLEEGEKASLTHSLIHSPQFSFFMLDGA